MNDDRMEISSVYRILTTLPEWRKGIARVIGLWIAAFCRAKLLALCFIEC